MATISSANMQTLCDNVAAILAKVLATFTAQTDAVNEVVAGLSGPANSTQAHLAALADFNQEFALQTGALSSIENMIALLGSITAPNTYYTQVSDFLNALDLHVDGLNSYLVAHQIQVHPAFAAAFNLFVATGKRATDAIATSQIFPAADTDLATITVTAGNAATVTGQPTGVGPVPLWLYNTGSTTTAPTQFAISYLAPGGATLSANVTLSVGMQPGKANAIPLGISATAISGVSILGNGTAGDHYTIYAPLLRTITY